MRLNGTMLAIYANKKLGTDKIKMHVKSILASISGVLNITLLIYMMTVSHGPLDLCVRQTSGPRTTL